MEIKLDATDAYKLWLHLRTDLESRKNVKDLMERNFPNLPVEGVDKIYEDYDKLFQILGKALKFDVVPNIGNQIQLLTSLGIYARVNRRGVITEKADHKTVIRGSENSFDYWLVSFPPQEDIDDQSLDCYVHRYEFILI